jgi:predicted transcriptional regulator
LSPFDQLQEIAMEAALIRMQVMIGAETEALKLSSSEAKRIARFELARYAAQALMMPYRQFRDAAVRARYDVDVLRSRFGVSFQQAANRLTTLQRQGNSALPFFLMEIDHAGNRLRMAGSQGFPVRFGGQCPKLPVYAAFTQAGQVLVEPAELPDGSAFLTIARTLEGPHGAFNERPRRTAILLGCSLDAGSETIYGANSAPRTEIGPACRLCERQGCITRAEPPLTRPLGLDEMVAGLSAFDFQ